MRYLIRLATSRLFAFPANDVILEWGRQRPPIFGYHYKSDDFQYLIGGWSMFACRCAQKDYGACLSLLVAYHLGYIGTIEQGTF
jgi:hypothetical protein